MQAYKRHGHRISLLPIAAACGQAPRLSERHGAGRPAAMSSAFHAAKAAKVEALGMLARLSPSEREEVEGWHDPADVIVEGSLLTYAEAEKEIPLGLDDFGWFVEPTSGEDCLTIGHMDFGWVRDVVANPTCLFTGCNHARATWRTEDSFMCDYHALKMNPEPEKALRRVPQTFKIAYVADIKKTVWTTAEGPDSLQVHAYGWAYAQKHGADAYCRGLWLATEGEWVWSTEIVYLDSKRGRDIWERIYAAATHVTEEFSTGPHCDSCWSRLHCPEWTLPAALADSWLAPVAEGGALTDAAASEMLIKGAAFAKVWEKAKEQIQEAVRRGAVRPENGDKVYRWSEMPGRKGVDMARLKADLGDDFKKYEKVGNPYPQFGWKRAKGAE